MTDERADLVIVLLPDEEFAAWAVANRTGLATNFPVHLTVKTRFYPEVPHKEIVRQFAYNFRPHPFTALLTGPHYIGGRIKWIECEPSAAGYDHLLDIHRICYELVQGTSRNAQGDFEGRSFRPHVTLDWNDRGISVPPKTVKESIHAKVRFESWAILRYPRNALRKGVTQVHRSTFRQRER